MCKVIEKMQICAKINDCVYISESVLPEMPQESWRHHLIWLSSSLQRLTEEGDENRGTRLEWNRHRERTSTHELIFSPYLLLSSCLNACVFLFPLVVVRAVCQIFSPCITAERSCYTVWLLQVLIRGCWLREENAAEKSVGKCKKSEKRNELGREWTE